MNKETIYIENSDDITNILSKLTSSDKKVVALVPPKKNAVLLSAVNMKLISRTARLKNKAVVLVTTDDALTKLAMSVGVPVAPSLKSRPVIPGADSETPELSADETSAKTAQKTEVETAFSEVESSPSEEHENNPENEPPEEDSEDSEETEDSSSEASRAIEEIESEETDDDDEEKDSKKDKRAKETKNAKRSKSSKKDSSSPLAAFLNSRAKWIVFGILIITALAVFFVWALMIAPAVKVSVSIRTNSTNFSENVTFTKNPADESIDSGIFSVNEETLEKEQVVKFTATGQKDLGERASGKLVISTSFDSSDYSAGNNTVSISAGTKFTYNGLEYEAGDGATLSLRGTSPRNLVESCDNVTESSVLDFDFFGGDTCQVSSTITIVAAVPGEQYNIPEGHSSGWSSSIGGIAAYNPDAISGGTSKIVTVVLQSDVDTALSKLSVESQDSGKNEILAKLSDSVFPIESSFEAEASNPQPNPAVGAEVPEGTTPTVTSKAVYKILTVDTARIEEFIENKTNLDENSKIYSYGSPFVEYFTSSSETTYSGKLKTTYKTGPKISETEILDEISGQKIGRVEPILKDKFSGISSVAIEKSYFWVNSVPKNPNVVTINLEVEE